MVTSNNIQMQLNKGIKNPVYVKFFTNNLTSYIKNTIGYSLNLTNIKLNFINTKD